jgi:hypothetical protein
VIAFPGHVDESLLYQFGIHCLLARRNAGGVGSASDYWRVLASAACVSGGNLLACSERWLFCERVQEQDLSLHVHRAAFSDRRNCVPFV